MKLYIYVCVYNEFLYVYVNVLKIDLKTRGIFSKIFI